MIVADFRNDSFYCGITNDIDIRMQQHRNNDFNIVRNQVGAWLCRDVECATEVERRMGEFGYDIGRGNKAGNGANDDSRYVYILKKGKCTTGNVSLVSFRPQIRNYAPNMIQKRK